MDQKAAITIIKQRNKEPEQIQIKIGNFSKCQMLNVVYGDFKINFPVVELIDIQSILSHAG